MIHYCSETNSTLFTDCCGTAICEDEEKCPGCGKVISPRSDRSRHDVAMEKWYGREKFMQMKQQWIEKARREALIENALSEARKASIIK